MIKLCNIELLHDACSYFEDVAPLAWISCYERGENKRKGNRENQYGGSHFRQSVKTLKDSRRRCRGYLHDM